MRTPTPFDTTAFDEHRPADGAAVCAAGGPDGFFATGQGNRVPLVERRFPHGGR